MLHDIVIKVYYESGITIIGLLMPLLTILQSCCVG
jgi:hypothetical protein